MNKTERKSKQGKKRNALCSPLKVSNPPSVSNALSRSILSIVTKIFFIISILLLTTGAVVTVVEYIRIQRDRSTSFPAWAAFVFYLLPYSILSIVFLCAAFLCKRIQKRKRSKIENMQREKLGNTAMTYGEKIYTLREKSGLSQEELAEKLEVSRQTISNWENDKVKIDIVKAKQLCDIFQISIEDFCSEKYVLNERQAEQPTEKAAKESDKAQTEQKQTPQNNKKLLSNRAIKWILLGASLLFFVIALIDTIKTGKVTIGSTIQFKSSWWMVALVSFACCAIVFLSKKKK